MAARLQNLAADSAQVVRRRKREDYHFPVGNLRLHFFENILVQGVFFYVEMWYNLEKCMGDKK